MVAFWPHGVRFPLWGSVIFNPELISKSTTTSKNVTPLNGREDGREPKLKLSRNSSINYIDETGVGPSESRASLRLD